MTPADSQVSWRSLCHTAGDRELTVTTSDGKVIYGYCGGIGPNEVALRDQKPHMVKVSRTALSQVMLERSKGHQLRALGRGLSAWFREGGRELLTPAGPLGVVVLPMVAAWGVVSAPFCAVGDLVSKVAGQQEITIE